MSGKQYLKNQLPVLLLNLLGVLALALFLIATGTSRQAISFIALVWIVVVVCYLTVSFFIQKRHCETLLVMAEQLGEKYLMPEVMSMPEREYKEYIEQWIHEVKTPITAMKLICENNRSEFTRELLVEVENINHFTEQALYYARSEHTEKDYTVREIRIRDVVHDAIADSKYLLRKNHVTVEVEDDGKIAYMDDKWVRFILNQIISNAVKYRTEQPSLRFSTAQKHNQVILSVEDNGIGIPQSDLPRVFEKGFTGQNGRTVHSSTGIGLYLCKRLCDKLGIGLSVCSQGNGTSVSLIFPINDFVAGVQG